MSEHSPNLNLNLYTEADGGEKFRSFVEKLTGPGADSNMMLLDAALKAQSDKLENAVLLDENGKVPAGQLPEMNYDPAGSAAAVQEALTAHTENETNPHGVTAAQAGALPLTGGTLSGPLSVGEPMKTTQHNNFRQNVDKKILSVGEQNVVLGLGAAAVGRKNVVCPGDIYECSMVTNNTLDIYTNYFPGTEKDKIILFSGNNVTFQPQIVEIASTEELAGEDIVRVKTVEPFTGSPNYVILPDIESNSPMYYTGTAEGARNLSTGKIGSHAEGSFTRAKANGAHSEGYYTIAHELGSHAEGYRSEAKGQHSHAEGTGTVAVGKSSHVEGSHNIEDIEDKYLHIAGNGGSSSARSNAYTLDWDGNGWYAGKVSAGTAENPAVPTQDNDLVTKKSLEDALAQSAPAYLSGTEDLTAGTSPLETGTLYFLYE